METTTTTTTTSRNPNATAQVELYDESGHLIGVITRPVVRPALGPGREKVYLARRGVAAGGRGRQDSRPPQAA